MNAATLIETLTELERALEGAPTPIRSIVVDAQECALGMQHLIVELLRENDSLRQRIENADRSSLFRLSQPRISEDRAEEMGRSRSISSRAKDLVHRGRHVFKN